MTVTELIAALQGYPPDAVVAVRDRQGYVVAATGPRHSDGYYDARSFIQAPTVVIA